MQQGKWQKSLALMMFSLMLASVSAHAQGIWEDAFEETDDGGTLLYNFSGGVVESIAGRQIVRGTRSAREVNGSVADMREALIHQRIAEIQRERLGTTVTSLAEEAANARQKLEDARDEIRRYVGNRHPIDGVHPSLYPEAYDQVLREMRGRLNIRQLEVDAEALHRLSLRAQREAAAIAEEVGGRLRRGEFISRAEAQDFARPASQRRWNKAATVLGYYMLVDGVARIGAAVSGRDPGISPASKLGGAVLGSASRALKNQMGSGASQSDAAPAAAAARSGG